MDQPDSHVCAGIFQRVNTPELDQDSVQKMCRLGLRLFTLTLRSSQASGIWGQCDRGMPRP